MSAARPFLILALPRSRTAWISSFFTIGPSFCWHDLTAEEIEPDEVAQMMRLTPGISVGNCDTGAVLCLQRLLEGLAAPRIAYVRREPLDCARSLSDVSGLGFDECAQVCEKLDGMLDTYEEAFPGFSIHFDELDSEKRMQEMWEHLIPEHEFPRSQCVRMRDLWIEVKPAVLQKAARGEINPVLFRLLK